MSSGGGGSNYPGGGLLSGLWANQSNTYSPYTSPSASDAMHSAYLSANNITPTANFAGASQQALNTAFDPQNALHNKLFQQQQDQNRANQAAAGVATTPYGSGLSTQGDQNFDIAWQQAQLANQAQGAQTAQTLQNAALAPGQQRIQDLLSYSGQGLQGTNDMWNAMLNAMSGTTGVSSAINQAGYNNSLLNAQGLSGLGQLGGTLLGYGLFGG